MLKALLLDLDETLCDTLGANEQAKILMAQDLDLQYGIQIDGMAFANQYVSGIYREWSKEQQARYMPIIEQQSEGAFRVQLIKDLLAERSIDNINDEQAQFIQDKFDANRLNAFDFFPGIVDFLAQARKNYTLVVITNGPEFSQLPKVKQVKLFDHVDHVIIGGQEPEQKPASSIFNKALTLANCQADEAVHIGDSLTADIAGANNSGIKSVWIKHQQAQNNDVGITPDYILEHPSEIPFFIENFNSDSTTTDNNV